MPFTSLSKILECWESQLPAESTFPAAFSQASPVWAPSSVTRWSLFQLITQPELWAALR